MAKRKNKKKKKGGRNRVERGRTVKSRACIDDVTNGNIASIPVPYLGEINAHSRTHACVSLVSEE